MSELTPKANELLREYQNYTLQGYEATEDEWAAFGRKAVSALYEMERAFAALEAENKALLKFRTRVWHGCVLFGEGKLAEGAVVCIDAHASLPASLK